MKTVRLLILAASSLALLPGCGSTIKASFDGTGDGSTDTHSDMNSDVPADLPPDGTGEGQCEDGLDNDGDDLIDMDDWDCEHIYDSTEGPGEDCTMDNHCEAGWLECDHETGECYEPPMGELCAGCVNSEDCGDGVTGEDPDRDFCVHYGSGTWNCSKDCQGDFDCPRGFQCDFGDDGYPPGYCRPWAISCDALDLVGESCTGEYDCLGAMPCHGDICTYECESNRQCPDTTTCTSGWCIPD